MNWQERLIELGFRQVGTWQIEGKSISFILETVNLPSKTLFAFVSSNEVLYIGSTTKDLIERMNEYKNPGPSQSTHIAGHSNILEWLFNKRPVDIIALTELDEIGYKGLQLNPAMALKDQLIKEIRPRWNKKGT